MKNYLAVIIILCLFPFSAMTQTQTIEFNPQKISDLQVSIRANDQRVIQMPFISDRNLTLILKPHKQFTGEIKDRFPNHNSYRVTSPDDPSISGFLLDSPTGIFYTLNTSDGFVSFKPTKKKNIYEFERGFPEAVADHMCQVEEDLKHDHVHESRRVDVPFSSGEFLRIYRMALVITGEFYELNGNNDDDVLSWVQFTLDGMNTIFQRDLAMNFEVGNRLIFYNDRETDPFIPDNDGGAFRLDQSREVISDIFDEEEYDIGHVLHNYSDSDDTWSSGGIARLNSLCRESDNPPGVKAMGWSGSFNTQTNSWIQLFSHEIGHQCGASHTFNGTGSNCTNAISSTNAYEIASGSTIMSYRGICASEYNVPFSITEDNYFHINSLNAIVDLINDQATCNTVFETNNIPPDLDINPCNVEAYRIPKSTPFRMRAVANDLNGDVITYAWEQYDEDGEGTPTQGFIGDEAANSPIGPLFRNYTHSTNPERTIPLLNDILSGEQNPFEVLPAVERNITMRLTARDNFSGGGTISVDEINISVEDGPFEFVSPSATSNFYEAGNSLLIEWNTNGSESLCDNVDILLSTDGGLTFNIPIAEDLSYSGGNYTWDIPGGLQRSPNNRIKIECADYSCFSFFIISEPFEIDSECEGNAHFICDTEDVLAQEGSDILNLDLESTIGQKVLGLNVEIDGNAPQQIFVRRALNGACQIPTFPSGNPVFTPHQIRSFTVEESGVYTFRRLTSGFYSIFNTAMMLSDEPCAGFLGSNAVEASNNPGTVSTSSSSSVTVQLEACVNYSILFTTFQTPLNMAVDVNGSEIIEIEDLLEGTNFTYVGVNKQNNEVAFISETGDLREIDFGFYDIYGAQYQDGLDPESWIGLSFGEILTKGDCFIAGSNSKEVTILDDGIDPCDGFFIFTNSTPSDCLEPNGTASLDISLGNPPFFIEWSNGMTGQTISGLVAGTYMVTVLDAENCAQEGQVDVDLAAPLTVNILENNGMLITQVANGSGMYNYEWLINNNPSMVTTENIGLQESGTYTVIVTDMATGCANSDSYEFNNPCAGFTIIPNFENPSCFGDSNGSIVIETMGGDAPYSYEWEDGLGTENMLTDLVAGIYTVVVTDGANCSAQSTVELSDPDEIVLIVEGTNESSLGAGDGSAMVVIEGGIEPFSYEWNDGTTTDNIVNLMVGEYCVTVTDANECISESCIEIEAGADPCVDFSVVIEAINVSCFEIPNGSATAIPSEGTEPFTFFWSHSVSGEVVENLEAGMYEVTVIDANDCEAIASVEITQPTALELTLEKENESTLDAADGSIQSSVSGGTEPYTYEWNNGETIADLELLEPGQYCVTITDANECTIQDCITIVEGTDPCGDFTIQASSSDITCFGFENGTAIVVPSGGMEPYSYEWSNGETTQSIDIPVAGLYDVTISDANNCEVVEIFEITEPDENKLQLTSNAESILGAGDGMASADVNGNTETYTFLWDNGETTATITMLEPGTYCVTVTDQSDCPLEDCIEVMAGDDPCTDFEVSLSGTDVTCFDGIDGTASASISGGTEPFSIVWEHDFDLANQSSITDLVAGTYTIIVTDVNLCIQTASIDIGSAEEIVLEINSTNESNLDAADGMATAMVTGGDGNYTYVWSDGRTTSEIDMLAPGEYCLTVTDGAECSMEGCVEILAGEDICADFELNVAVEITPCFGTAEGGAFAEISGGMAPYTYEWSNGEAADIITGLEAGVYSVTVTDTNDCILIDEVEIVSHPELVLNLEKMDESSLMSEDGSVEASVTGGAEPYTYEWSNNETTQMITALNAGEYCVTVTDANGCIVEACAEILAGEDVCAEFTLIPSIENATCAGLANGSITLESSGGMEPYTYEWSNGLSEQSVSDLAAGVYGITVTDANDCVITDEIEITENEALDLEINTTNESSLMSADGTAMAVLSNGTMPLTYEWSNGETTQMITALNAGEYCVTVTDGDGCVAEACAEILAGEDVCADFSITVSSEDAPCFGSPDGAALIETTGGTEPYTYEWSNGETEAIILGLAVGVYTVTVTDANDCVLEDEIEIAQSEELLVEVETMDESSLMSADGTATAIISGGTEPYSYNWSNGANTQSLTDLGVGEYCVTVTDNFGCTVEACGEVLGGDDPCVGFEISLTGNDVACFGGSDGVATVITNGGMEPFTYEWDHDASSTMNTTYSDLAVGTYTVIVTDVNMCVQTASIDIGSTDEIILTLTSTDESVLDAEDGTATIVASGGTAPYGYSWSNGATTATIGMLTAGEYCVTTTDDLGCTAESCIDVTGGTAQPCPDIIVEVLGTDAACFGGTGGSASITYMGGTEPFTVIWSDGQTEDNVSDLAAGTYTVTVSDANDCSSETSVEISQPSAISISATTQSNESATGASDGQISVSINGGTMPYTYGWSNGDNTTEISGLAGGIYSVTVIDANDCLAEQSYTISTNGSNNGMATVQFIHAALDETISIDSDQGMILPYFANTMTTPPMEVPAGQNMLLTLTPLNFWSNAGPVTLGASFEEGKSYVAILYGTFDESDNNPVGITIKEHNFGIFGEDEVFFDFFNGAHDSPSFSLTNNNGLEIVQTPYGEFASETDLANVSKPSKLDLFNADIDELTNSFWADFTWWKSRSAVLFTQGTLSERGSLELWVALADGGAYQLNGYFYVGGHIVNPGSIVAEENRLSIAPNPAKQTPNVRLELIERSDVDILIFHSSGKLVYRNSFKQMDAGTHDLSPLGLNLETGNYFVELRTNRGKHLVPIIIVD